MKTWSYVVKHVLGMAFFTMPYLACAVVIDNGLAPATANYFSVDVVTGGKTEDVKVTNPSAITPQGIVYLYDLHIIVGGVSSVLSGGAPTFVGPASDNKLISSGNFMGSEGNTIEWTVESSIQSNSSQMRNVISFAAVSGTLGDLQVIQYMDQDVDGASDDVFFTRGDAAQGNIELFTLDDDNPNNVGVSQGGAQLEEQGLINTSFDGWGACVYDERSDFTDGSTTYSKSGVICPTLDNALPKVNHPVAGTVSAAADVITTMSWTVNKNSNQSVIVSTLGGVPDAGVALAIDDYINIVENTSTLESITFDALANDVALDIPVTFLKTSDPTNGSISLNGSVITYTPDLNYFGQDSFTYSITDNSGDSDTATIYLNVEEDTNANGVSDAEETAALEVVKNYADNGTNPKPTEVTYSNLPATGVMASNIVEINAAIENLNLVDVDTVAEIQAVIDQVISDLNTASLVELVEDLNGNANATSLTLPQLKNIVGVVGVIDDDLADYNAAFVAAPSPFADINNPTVAEINAVIASVNAINELVEDLNGDANATVLTLTELKAIQGTEDIIDANMAGYNTAFVAAPSPFADINNPTVAEINAVIDEVNSDVALAELVEDLNGDTNATPITAEQLKDIQGVTGVVDADIADYNAAFVAAPSPFADINNPTVAEINAVIASVNAINELVEDLNGDANATVLSLAELKAIQGLEDIIDANMASYNTAFVAAPSPFTDIDNPTVAEINAVIASVNAINELVEDLNGDANATPITAEQLKDIQGIVGVIDADIADYNAAFVAAPSPFADINNPTVAEINAVIASVNAINELVEDLNGDANATVLTLTELKAIQGTEDIIDANMAGYNTAFVAAPSPFADIDNPTIAEINAVIDEVNSNVALAELVEDLNGDTNATALTAEQLKDIQGVTGVVDADIADYNAAFVAAPSPFADIDNPTVTEINAVIASINAINELVEDLNGDANSTVLTLTELKAIQGLEDIIDANMTGYNTAFVAAPSPFADINNPTIAEINAVIDEVNSDVALAELVEDLNGDTNSTPLTAEQLKDIQGVTGVVDADIADYNAAFVAAPSPFADINNPTVAEINAVIASVNAINELVEDLNGDANATVLTLAQLKDIQGTEDIIDANMAGYNTAFVAAPSPFADINNPTIAEINAVIDEVNSDVALAELVEDLNGNTNATALTAEQLKDIQGIVGVVDADIADYNAAFVAAPSPFADIDNPTVAEINAVIASVNAINELVEDLNGDANATVLTLAQLKDIQGTEDIIDANMAGYNTAFVAAPSPFADIDNPTIAEINAVIDEVNSDVALTELVEDLNGDTNATALTAEQLKDIQGVTGVVDADVADYNAAFVAAPSPFADINNPTVAEINEVIASVNAINELVEDLNGDANATVLTLTELKAIQGLEDIIDANMTGYNTAFVAAPSPFADINNPTIAEINAVIDEVNSDVALAELVEDLNGDTNSTPLTAEQLKDIQGVTGVVDADIADYNAAFVAAPSPFADINNPTVAEINAVIASVNAINELVEDLNGDANATVLTLAQLKDIQGTEDIIDANMAGYNTAFVAAPSPFADINNPTIAEINAVIDEVNSDVALAELVEDLNGNTNATALTAEQLKDIQGVTGVVDADIADYNAAFVAAPSPFADIDNPTVTEINAVIASVNAINELVEDLNGDANATVLTLAQLKDIQGTEDIIDANMAGYNTAFVAAPSPFADIDNPTIAEINAVIDEVNSNVALAELVEDLNGDTNATALTAEQLKDIQGIVGVVDADIADYNAAFVAAPSPFADINNPTVAEINAVIASVNAINELVEDLNGDANTTVLTLTELKAIQGTEDIIDANMAGYNTAFVAAPSPFADIDNPTIAEINAVIDEVNSDVALAELVEDLNGDTNATALTAEQLKDIQGIVGVVDADIADYNAAFVAAPSPFADINNPTVAEINAVIASVNAINELVEDLNGDANATVLTLTELKAIQGTEDIIDANMTGYNTAFVAAPSPFVDIDNPTIAEINAVIDEVNSDVALAELVEDLNGDTNATALTAEQLKDIQGIVGVVDADIADYNAAFVAAPSPFADINNPTVAEINAVIASVNAINELVEDLNGDANATVLTLTELKAIQGLEDIIDANMSGYNTAFVAAPSPFADINNPTVAEINAVIASVNAINELVEDLNGDANTTVLTLTELKAIQGTEDIIDANMTGYNTAFVAAPSPFVDINNPTIAEINAVIASVNAINELVEDLSGDSNATPLTSEQLKDIQGVTGVVDADTADYNAAFVVTPSPFADINNPTVAEINAVIASVNAINELVEDLNGDANTTVLTLTELKAIKGTEDIIDANMAGYNTAFVAAPSSFADIDNPTIAEINAVIDEVNSDVALAELVEDLNGDGNSTPLTSEQLKDIQGVTGVVDADIADYNAAFVAAPSPFADINNPTVAEINAVIASVNAINELVEDLNGDANATVLTLTQLKDIQGTEDIIDANMAGYNIAFVAAPSPFADIDNPTIAEINAVIASVNAVTELVDDLNGNGNATTLSLVQLQGIQGIESITDAEIDAYNAAFIAEPSPFADINNPTVNEVQAVIDAINVIVANEVAAIEELKEDIASNSNNDLVEATELNAIRGVDGALTDNQADYQAGFIATNPSPFADTNNPTAEEIQAVIDSVNVIVANETAVFAELIEDIAGDTNNGLIQASDLNSVRGISGAVDENQEAYQNAFTATTPSPFSDPGNPTAAEVQAVIAAVNNGGPDTDGDGMPDSIDNDDDNDGLLDIDETDIGRINPDQDADGICDGNLAVTNTCVAGPDANPTNPDSDGNGICDGIIAFPATNDDSGCMPNINLNPNADSDNDGITDDSELIGDSDGDLIPDYLDADANGTAPNSGDSDKDGIDDSTECGSALPCRDSDKDGIYDHLDTDSDNDGISDDEEADGIAGNGEDLAATDGSVQPKDTDKDGKPDYRDEDSDNDGVADRDEVNQPHNPLNPKDSDNDGIPDLVDHDDRSNTVGGGDSDNDGLSDAQECPVYPTNCPDTDGDGKADYLDNNKDSDGDGIADTDEDPNFDKDNDPATNPRDTDGDGIPDYLDDDSDNDGVKDSDERNEPYDANNPRDTDGDGIPDVVDADDDGANGAGDSDGDGIPDSVECSSQPCRDTDGDGIPDYTDTDSDNDGLLDADEVGANPEQPKDTDGDGIPDIADKVSESGVESGGDSDGDGIPDADECTSWPNCIDSDNDGLADYLDNDRSPVIVREFGKVKTGVQGAGNLHWALGLMLLLLAVRRKSTVLIVVPLMATTLNANAVWWDEMDVYAGAGIGQSYLTPSLGQSGYSIDDHTDNAWKLTAGWDWNDHISIEGYYTDLGRVSLKPGASIGYRMMGGDAILHFWAYGEERIEGSVAVYAKGGLNHMTNTGKRVSYEKNNTLQLMGGVGAEYYLPHKFSVRFEIESYDADAALFSLNLVKRFGFNSRKTKNKQPIAIVKPVPKAVVPLAVIAPVIIVLDTDKDGLLDDKDQCPNTPPGVAVNELGCAKVKEEMGDLITKLQFESSSSSLTEPSKIALNEVAALLTKYDEVQVQVQAHSDNTGSASYNKKLSQKRAESVVQYLVDKNIEISRLEPVGYGEEQPIANNNSPEGRAKNRRVEFVLK